MNSNKPRLCFIGFGEAGQAIASGLREAGVEQIAAWDILFPEDEGARLQAGRRDDRRAARELGGRRGRQLRHHHFGGDGGIEPRGGAIGRAASVRQSVLLSTSTRSRPAARRKPRRLLGDAARYVDVAILAPIHPKRHQTPLLLAGPHAQAVMPLLIDELDMRGAIASDEVGAAAALKMIRSVMIKGIEALTAECFLAAQRAGIATRSRPR